MRASKSSQQALVSFHEFINSLQNPNRVPAFKSFFKPIKQTDDKQPKKKPRATYKTKNKPKTQQFDVSFNSCLSQITNFVNHRFVLSFRLILFSKKRVGFLKRSTNMSSKKLIWLFSLKSKLLHLIIPIQVHKHSKQMEQ